jgi:transcriptional regulator with XRE-family HTH domain
MTCEGVGELVGLRQPQISRIESGVQAYFTQPVREKVEKLAGLLNVTGLEFVEGYWETRIDDARAVRLERVEKVVGPAPKSSLTPFQQIAAVIEVSRMGALAPDAALAAISNICAENG